MSNEAPQADPKYKQPINGQNDRPKLEASALVAFRTLLWFGLIVTVLSFIISFTAPMSVTALGFQIGIPLLAAAGVVAGLGKRETHDTTTS